LLTDCIIIGELISKSKRQEETHCHSAEIDDHVQDKDGDNAAHPTKGKAEKFFIVGPSNFANFNRFFFNDLIILF
jgi:hypothetical protein